MILWLKPPSCGTLLCKPTYHSIIASLTSCLWHLFPILSPPRQMTRLYSSLRKKWKHSGAPTPTYTDLYRSVNHLCSFLLKASLMHWMSPPTCLLKDVTPASHSSFFFVSAFSLPPDHSYRNMNILLFLLVSLEERNSPRKCQIFFWLPLPTTTPNTGSFCCSPWQQSSLR